MKYALSSFVFATVFAICAFADPETSDMKINDFSPVPPAPTAAEGTAPRILPWQDGKKAVFFMAFDDGCVSQLDNAIPLMQKYGAIGTFYPIIDAGFFKGQIKRWEALADDPHVVFGNHTLTHGDFPDAAKFESEVQAAEEALHQMTPKAKWPRLMSFGKPGVKVWNVSKEDFNATLSRHNLIDRPPFLGAAINVTTIPQAEKLVDEALASGGMGHLDFHGVGGDWLAPSTEFFEGLLKKLLAEKDKVWQPSAIDYHKYFIERDASKVEVVKKSPLSVSLKLTSTADPVLYDLPLTVEADVPANWKKCHVEAEGLKPVDVAAVQGRVRFYALPGAITLTQGK